MHIARAYGVTPSNPTPQSPGSPGAPHTEKPATTPNNERMQSLLAARVAEPVNFDAPTAASDAEAPALPLYTRAADKVEAAVAVQVGRTIDVKG